MRSLFRSLSVPRISLTDATIRALKPTGTQETYWCKRIHLGKYPATSLKYARERARALLLNPAAGMNGKTLAETFDAYFQSAVQPNYRPRSAKEVRRLFSDHLYELSERPILSITTADLSSLFARMSHTPSEANHLYAMLRTFYRQAVQGNQPRPRAHR
jgi:hypothetical protein